MKRLGLALWLLPQNTAVLLLRAYRAVISPLYGDVCRYYPSCSAYGLESVQRFGVIRGGALTAWRLLRCNPWSRGGVDDVPQPTRPRYLLSRRGFVIAPQHGKA